MPLNWGTSKLHIITKVHIQTFILSHLLNNSNLLTNILICLSLCGVQPCFRFKVLILTYSIANLIDSNSRKWESKSRTITINTRRTNFRSSSSRETKPCSSRSIRMMIGNTKESRQSSRIRDTINYDFISSNHTCNLRRDMNYLILFIPEVNRTLTTICSQSSIEDLDGLAVSHQISTKSISSQINNILTTSRSISCHSSNNTITRTLHLRIKLTTKFIKSSSGQSPDRIDNRLPSIISRPLCKLCILNILRSKNGSESSLIESRTTSTTEITTISIKVLESSTWTEFKWNSHLSIRNLLNIPFGTSFDLVGLDVRPIGIGPFLSVSSFLRTRPRKASDLVRLIVSGRIVLALEIIVVLIASIEARENPDLKATSQALSRIFLKLASCDIIDSVRVKASSIDFFLT